MSTETRAGRELDVAVAERVMGWPVIRASAPNHHNRPAVVLYAEPETPDDVLAVAYDERSWEFKPSTDPAADYSVLVKVRETFTCQQFAAMLAALQQGWANRFAQRQGVMPTDHPERLCMLYEPGDYARAALAALPPAGQEKQG